MQTKVQHPELHKLLLEKNKLVQKGRKLTKEIEDLETERNKYGLQIQKLKDQIVPLAEGLIKDKLGEFEMLTMINAVEGKGHFVVLEYVDQVEEFKKALTAKKNSENTSENSTN